MGLLKSLFGDYSKREVKRIQPLCDKVLALEEEYRAMSDETLRAQTDKLKNRLETGETLDDILPEAFATCREAAEREHLLSHEAADDLFDLLALTDVKKTEALFAKYAGIRNV